MKKYLTNTYLNVVLFALINILLSTALKQLNFINDYVFMLIDLALTFSILCLFSFYNSQNGILSKKLFRELLLIGISGSFLIALSKYVYYEFINPDAILELLYIIREQLKTEGYSSSQITSTIGFYKSFTSPTAISIMSFIGYSISSLIGAAICPLIFNKKQQS